MSAHGFKNRNGWHSMQQEARGILRYASKNRNVLLYNFVIILCFSRYGHEEL